MNINALVIDDDPDLLTIMGMTLTRMDLNVDLAGSVNNAKNLIQNNEYDLCITDFGLNDGNGFDIIKHFNKHNKKTPIAIISGQGNTEIAQKAFSLGAVDFISKPVTKVNLERIIKSYCGDKAANITSSKLLGNSRKIALIRDLINKMEHSIAPVYIFGNSGTGKELVAREIHENSPHKRGKFIAANCSAIPNELMESEFFGYTKGSFTGAHINKIGMFEAADQGTLFLDEIADLPITMQGKLLRALQDGVIKPIGQNEEKTVNTRIISATNKDLRKLVQEGNFREDLFYRLNVIEIQIPNLKERKEDLELLANSILAKLCAKLSLKPKSLSNSALAKLRHYNYPGNVRELENILYRTISIANEAVISEENLILDYKAEGTTGSQQEVSNLDEYLDHIARNMIITTLNKNNWNRTKTAKKLGLSLRVLRYKMEKLGINEPKLSTTPAIH
jgi:two-component system response regulator PilR (NtrC family)